MKTLQQFSLPYQEDPTLYFEKLLHLPNPCLLDSCHSQYPETRYTILTAAPLLKIISNKQHTQIVQHGQIKTSTQPILDILQQTLTLQPTHSEFPFCGGFLGSFAYDLGKQFEQLPSTAQDDLNFPDVMVGLYDWAIVFDHQLKRGDLVSFVTAPETETTISKVLQCLQLPTPTGSPFKLTKPWQANMTRDQYGHKFRKIIDYLTAGDCYQVNLTQRFHSQYQGDLWQAYQSLRQNNPAPYSAYCDFSPWRLISCSPERFLKLQQQQVQAKPIKGTCPR